MEADTHTRSRASSRAEYLQNLRVPSPEEVLRISEIQQQRQRDNDLKYQNGEEYEAATKIQKAYRGHRARRQLNGLTLTPSARWTEVIREWRYQSAAAPQYGPGSARIGADGRPRAASDVAKLNWKRLAQIAEHAGAGELRYPESEAFSIVPDSLDHSALPAEPDSMLMDMRYFLEMVDQKHRYGTNLVPYHEQWLRSKTDQNFFYWLDRGDARHLSLSAIPREKVERERVRYLSKDERKNYLVRVDEDGKLRWNRNNELITTSVEQFKDSMCGIVPKDSATSPAFQDESVMHQLAQSRHFVRQFVRTRSGFEPWTAEQSDTDSSSEIHEEDGEDVNIDPEQSCPPKTKKKAQKKFHVSPTTVLNHLMRASIKPGTWIYVSDTVGRLYVGIKASGSFQHASFLSGARISSAGSIGIEQGRLKYLSPLSGHYRPTVKSFRAFVDSLGDQGVDMSHLRISKTLEALQGLEYYMRTKKGLHHAVHPRERSDSNASNDRKHSESPKRTKQRSSSRRSGEAGKRLPAADLE